VIGAVIALGLAIPVHAPAIAVPPHQVAKAVTFQPGEYPGVGKRVIYSRSARRVWLVRADDVLSGTWSVTGHPTIPVAGEYRVFSRSIRTHTYDGRYSFGLMVRFYRTPRGSTVGFHDLPYLTGTSIPIMPLSQIGLPGYHSSGCVRQRPADAQRMWNWARIGTQVVVLD
jgi:hypothetical protein